MHNFGIKITILEPAEIVGFCHQVPYYRKLKLNKIQNITKTQHKFKFSVLCNIEN